MTNRRWIFLMICAALTAGAQQHSNGQEGGDGAYTPAVGGAERAAILAVLHGEYTTGSGSAVKFQVHHFKVHNGWAWINVVPLDPNGKIEGEEWPSLLHKVDGNWTIIDLVKIAEDLDDPVGPNDPSAKYLAELKKRYPGVPADIFPKGSEAADK